MNSMGAWCHGTTAEAITLRLSLSQFFFPLFADLACQFRTERVDWRKAVAPRVGAAGVENRPAVDEIAGIALIGMHRRIERRAPATVDDTDRSLGVAAGRHRPDHVLHVWRIDI